MQLSLQVPSISKRAALTNEDYEDLAYCLKFARIIMQRFNDHLVHRSNDHFIVNSLVV